MINNLKKALPVLLTIMLLLSPAYAAEKQLTASMKLLLTSSTFIVANERKFTINSSTIIKNIDGKIIRPWNLKTNKKVTITYYFSPSDELIATVIEQ